MKNNNYCKIWNKCPILIRLYKSHNILAHIEALVKEQLSSPHKDQISSVVIFLSYLGVNMKKLDLSSLYLPVMLVHFFFWYLSHKPFKLRNYSQFSSKLYCIPRPYREMHSEIISGVGLISQKIILTKKFTIFFRTSQNALLIHSTIFIPPNTI